LEDQVLDNALLALDLGLQESEDLVAAPCTQLFTLVADQGHVVVDNTEVAAETPYLLFLELSSLTLHYKSRFYN